MLSSVKTAIILFISLTILTGVVYPFLVTVCAQLFFTKEANGSLIIKNNAVIGSQLIGQSFISERYFWGRPSATRPFPYNAADSDSSNINIRSPQFKQLLNQRSVFLTLTDPLKRRNPPMNLLTASASGLDPDISPDAAFFQAPRIAAVHHLPLADINNLIKTSIKPRTFKLLGEPRVNVLELNLKLEDLHK